MIALAPVHPPAPRKRVPASGEEPFWDRAGAAWRQLAGSFAEAGFSFEWHEWEGSNAVDWARSFHPNSVEICLNLEGTGWVSAEGCKLQFVPGSAGFFVTNGVSLDGQRAARERHRFLSAEFSLAFLRKRLGSSHPGLHPLLRRCLASGKSHAGLSEMSSLTDRRRELLRGLLQPPVLKAAQQLWFESKALEFAAEFFFSTGESESELLCTRAQKLALERVERARQILLGKLADPPNLEELGRQVGCSHFYLSRTFTRQTGLTLTQFVRRARLERAAALLRAGTHNVTEAALEVGYSSLSHFSQAFHEVFGCCPGLYPLRTVSQQAFDHAGQRREES